MAFQPFGIHYQLTAAISLAHCKERLRDAKGSLFGAEGVPRGWVIGPFVWLWLSALNRHGPMLVGLMREDGTQTRLSVRAGSDLNGTAYFVGLGALLLFVFVQIGGERALGWQDFLLIGAIASAVIFLLFVAHIERRDAEPLIQFVVTTLNAKHS